MGGVRGRAGIVVWVGLGAGAICRDRGRSYR